MATTCAPVVSDSTLAAGEGMHHDVDGLQNFPRSACDTPVDVAAPRLDAKSPSSPAFLVPGGSNSTHVDWWKPQATDSRRVKCARPWVLVYKSLWPDLRSLSLWQLAFLLLFMAISIICSFIDFNFWAYPDTRPTPYKWTNDIAFGIPHWRRSLLALSGAASFTGAVCVVFAAKRKYGTFITGLVNSLCYGLFAWAYGYAGDAQLNIIYYIPTQIIGMYLWANSLNSTHSSVSKRLTILQWFFALAAATLLSVMFYYEIPRFAEAINGTYYFMDLPTPRILDSVSNGLSIIAQALLLLQYAEQWLFWLTINCIQIAMFSGVAGWGIEYNALLMWCFFLVNSTFGLLGWAREYVRENKRRVPRWIRTLLCMRGRPARFATACCSSLVEDASSTSKRKSQRGKRKAASEAAAPGVAYDGVCAIPIDSPAALPAQDDEAADSSDSDSSCDSSYSGGHSVAGGVGGDGASGSQHETNYGSCAGGGGDSGGGCDSGSGGGGGGDCGGGGGGDSGGGGGGCSD